MYPLTYSKSLIEVDGKKLIEKQIENLIQAQVTQIVIAVSHCTQDVKNFVKSKHYNIKISFLEVGSTDDSGIIIEKSSFIISS